MFDFDGLLKHWRPFSSVDETVFVDTRLQLHWAAQIVAAVGNTLRKPSVQSVRFPAVTAQRQR